MKSYRDVCGTHLPEVYEVEGDDVCLVCTANTSLCRQNNPDILYQLDVYHSQRRLGVPIDCPGHPVLKNGRHILGGMATNLAQDAPRSANVRSTAGEHMKYKIPTYRVSFLIRDDMVIGGTKELALHGFCETLHTLIVITIVVVVWDL